MLRRSTLLLVCLVVLGLSNRARADDSEDFAIGAAVAAFGVTDLTFSIRAAVLAANGDDNDRDTALAQGIIAAPQAVVFNGVLAALQHDNDAEEAFAAAHIPATMATALTVHGIWSAAYPDEDQRFLFLVSTAIGVNTMWTSFAIGTATSERDYWGDDGFIPGIYEILTTGPGVAIGIHQAVNTRRFRAGWIGIAAWSGLLSLHGGLFAADVARPSKGEWDDVASLPIRNLGFGPASLGAPVEGAPETPGLIVTGAF